MMQSVAQLNDNTRDVTTRKRQQAPKLSVVVVVYNIPREAARTLHSLSAQYQRYIRADDYEVIVVDNGSKPRFDPRILEHLSGNFRLIRIDPAPPSPARAVNRGLAEAKGDIIGVMIDGARIVTPGLLHFARHGTQLFDRAVVATLSWYLGFDLQRWAMRSGYNHAAEEALLAGIGWPNDGYRLFEVATPEESSLDGWLQPIAESNALFMSRASWDVLGDFDERFDAPGGGLVNHDVFRRALELPAAELVLLLGEGTFHQFHRGVATNASVERAAGNWTRWMRQYERIKGRTYEWPRPRGAVKYLGVLPRPALLQLVRTAVHPIPRHLVEPAPSLSSPVEPPLGLTFDKELWSLAPPLPCVDPNNASLVKLMHTQFRAGRYAAAASVARLVRSIAPGEPEPQRILSLLAAYSPQPLDAEYHRSLAKAHRALAKNGVA
ncbi:MAG: hypothetical protein QOF24_185 [Verrucomicrobiota bacterium]|jgi:glycosyltransferase involved in cell wall biosynthesis